MGNLFGKLTREGRLPLLAISIALYRAKFIEHKTSPTIIGYLAQLLESVEHEGAAAARFAGDVFGVYVLVNVLRRVIRLSRQLRSASVKGVVDAVGGRAMRVLKQVPVVKDKIAAEFDKMEADLEKSLKQPGREQLFTLPKKGLPKGEILAKMRTWYDKEKAQWHEGWVSGAVYHGGDEHIELQNEAFAMFAISNPLHPDVWPSVMQMEAEVCSMTAHMVNGGRASVCGTMTSGGTESILMATKSHRQWAYETMGITMPEVVAPETAHAAIDKACELLGIRLVKVPVDPVSFKVDPRTLKRYLTSDTIMIYSSAPQYPHGVIDPIEELSAIAKRHGCGLHVDCCLGGFVLPFARRLGYAIPKFDFELEGVTSMSCDTHKYGYAAKGTSVVLYATKELRQHQYFTYPAWPGGLYATPSTPGSRPGALIACTWASLVAVGDEGFMEATDTIMKAQARIKQAVRETDGVHLMGDPVAMIVALGSSRFNIYNLADKMHHKGWSLNSLQNPPCLHICVTLRTVEAQDRFISDLRECVKDCLTNPSKVEKGAAVYGMASSMPAGPVADMLRTYNDVVLKV